MFQRWYVSLSAGRAARPDHVHVEPLAPQPVAKEIADVVVMPPRRVQRGDTDKVLRQGNKLSLAGRDFGKQAVKAGIIAHGAQFARKAIMPQALAFGLAVPI